MPEACFSDDCRFPFRGPEAADRRLLSGTGREAGGSGVGSERRAGAAHRGARSSPRARRGRVSHLQYDFGGILGRRAEDRKDGHGGRCPGGSAQQGPQPAHHHRRRVRGRQAAQRRPRQRGPVPAGRGRGRRPGRGPADPLHPHPGVLLRERHQHPAGQQPGAPGGAAAAGEGRGPGGGRGRRADPGPALCAGDEPTFITMEGPCLKSTYLLLPGKSLHGSVGSSD